METLRRNMFVIYRRLSENHSGMETGQDALDVPHVVVLSENHSGMETCIPKQNPEVFPLSENHSGMETNNPRTMFLCLPAVEREP